MLYTPLYGYNKAGSSLLLPALTSTLVIDCKSLSTPTTATSVPPGGATHLCMRWSPTSSTVPQTSFIQNQCDVSSPIIFYLKMSFISFIPTIIHCYPGYITIVTLILCDLLMMRRFQLGRVVIYTVPALWLH